MKSVAYILAGGLGSRLRTVVADRAKPVALINGRPFIHYLFDQISAAECFSHIYVLAGYKSGSVRAAVAAYQNNACISVIAEASGLGTGGALRNALSMTEHTSSGFLVMNGDSFTKMSLRKFLANHSQQNCNISMVVTSDEASRLSGVTISNDMVQAFDTDIPPDEKLDIKKNAGIYYFSHNMIPHILQQPERFSIENNFFKKYAGDLRIRAYRVDGHFIDIGTPEDYERAQSIFGLKGAQS